MEPTACNPENQSWTHLKSDAFLDFVADLVEKAERTPKHAAGILQTCCGYPSGTLRELQKMLLGVPKSFVVTKISGKIQNYTRKKNSLLRSYLKGCTGTLQTRCKYPPPDREGKFISASRCSAPSRGRELALGIVSEAGVRPGVFGGCAFSVFSSSRFVRQKKESRDSKIWSTPLGSHSFPFEGNSFGRNKTSLECSISTALFVLCGGSPASMEFSVHGMQNEVTGSVLRVYSLVLGAKSGGRP